MNREQERREPSRAPRRAARFTSWIAPCVVLGVALIATGCGRTGHDVHGEAVVQGDAGGVDASMSDLGGGGQDALPERDAPPATPDTAEGPPPTPPLPMDAQNLNCVSLEGALSRNRNNGNNFKNRHIHAYVYIHINVSLYGHICQRVSG